MKAIWVGIGVITAGVLLATSAGAHSPFPFNGSREVFLEVIGDRPGGLELVEAERLFQSATTPETRHERPTEGSSRRLYVVNDPAYDVVDAVCHSFHGEPMVTPIARRLADGTVIVVNAMAVSGSDALCIALGLKVR